MKELLVALTLFMGMFNGSPAESSSTTTTTLAAIVPSSESHSIEIELCKCDGLKDLDQKNLCYAKASGDVFFCDRVRDEDLKNQCYTGVKSC